MKPIHLAQALVCGVYCLSAAPVEARFLQRDPVGYNDQINLYAYVGNDPINAADPSGMSCVMTANGSHCTWDAVNGSLSATDSRRSLGSFENVIDKAAANPNGIIQLGGTNDQGKIITVSMTGADFVKDATSRDIVYGGKAPLPESDPSAYRAQSATDPTTGRVTSTFYDRSIEGRSDRQIEETAAHEFPHQGAAEGELRNSLNRQDNGIGEHQKYYKDNLKELEKR